MDNSFVGEASDLGLSVTLPGERGSSTTACEQSPLSGKFGPSRALSLEVRSRAYATAVAAILGVLLVIAVSSTAMPHVYSVLGLALLAVGAERHRVRIRDRHEESISLLPTLLAALLGGPVAGLLVGVASFSLELKPSVTRWCAYTSTRGISGAVAGWAAATQAGGGISGALIATTIGATTIYLLDLVFVALACWVRRAVPDMRAVLRSRLHILATAVPFAIATVTMLLLAAREVSPWTLPLFLAPALAAHQLFVMYQTKTDLAEGLLAANARLQHASLGFASALVAALEARDKYTAGHSHSVASIAFAIGKEMNLEEDECALLRNCGLVHDIGKIGLPAALLEKVGRLTSDEREVIETHSELGAAILAKADAFAGMAEIVLHHHERFDGAGYPKGLTGTEIPLLSRVIAVADAYDAMTSDRAYRTALTQCDALDRLRANAGTQFDPRVVEAFLAVTKRESEFSAQTLRLSRNPLIRFGAALRAA